MCQTQVAHNIKTQFMFSAFFFENRAVCEIMWKNTVLPDRQQIITAHVLSVPLTIATDIRLEYVILIAFLR